VIEGDFRMVYGENPRKISNIVHGQYDKLQEIYTEMLKTIPGVTLESNSTICVAKVLLTDSKTIHLWQKQTY
jgi:hypothetical protein